MKITRTIVQNFEVVVRAVDMKVCAFARAMELAEQRLMRRVESMKHIKSFRSGYSSAGLRSFRQPTINPIHELDEEYAQHDTHAYSAPGALRRVSSASATSAVPVLKRRQPGPERHVARRPTARDRVASYDAREYSYGDDDDAEPLEMGPSARQPQRITAASYDWRPENIATIQEDPYGDESAQPMPVVPKRVSRELIRGSARRIVDMPVTHVPKKSFYHRPAPPVRAHTAGQVNPQPSFRRPNPYGRAVVSSRSGRDAQLAGSDNMPPMNVKRGKE